jgi:hypothetical protein
VTGVIGVVTAVLMEAIFFFEDYVYVPIMSNIESLQSLVNED